jgi:phage repressor protein C with HTH and peptisase S24 domain
MEGKSLIPVRIARLRHSLGLSYANFAKPLGVSHMTVRRWEREESEVTRAVVLTIADAYAVSIDWLLYGTGAMMADGSSRDHEGKLPSYSPVLHDVAARLRTARAVLGYSMRAFAEPLGVSHAAVFRWENCEVDISQNVALTIERCLGISSDWLLNGKGNMFVNSVDKFPTQIAAERILNPNVALNTQFVVPMLSITGSGNTLDDYLEEVGGLSFSQQWLERVFNVNPDNLCLMEIDGDSMIPTINSNDLMFIDGRHTVPAYSDGIWVLHLGGGLSAKRIQRLAGGQFRVISDNPAYHPLELDENARLLGRVVGVVKRF